MGKKIERNCQHERNEKHKIIQEARATFSWYKGLPVGVGAALAQQSCIPSQDQNLIPSYNKQLPDNTLCAICVQIPVTLHCGRCKGRHRTTSWPKDSRTSPWPSCDKSSPLCPIASTAFVASLHTQTMQEVRCPKGFPLITWSPRWEDLFKNRDVRRQKGNNRKKKRDTLEAKWDKHSTEAKVHQDQVCTWQAALVPANCTVTVSFSAHRTWKGPPPQAHQYSLWDPREILRGE